MGQEGCKTAAAALRKRTEERREVMPFQLAQRSDKLRVRRCAERETWNQSGRPNVVKKS